MADADVLAQLQKTDAQRETTGKVDLIDKDTDPKRQDAAKTKLLSGMRKDNKHEVAFNFTMLGNVSWVAGTTVMLDTIYGVAAGKYCIEKVVHRITPQGYISEIEGYKVLTGRGYDSGTAPKAGAAKPYVGPSANPTGSSIPGATTSNPGAIPGTPQPVAIASRS